MINFGDVADCVRVPIRAKPTYAKASVSEAPPTLKLRWAKAEEKGFPPTIANEYLMIAFLLYRQ